MTYKQTDTDTEPLANTAVTVANVHKCSWDKKFIVVSSS